MKSITLICIASFILSSLLSAQDTVSVKQTTKQKKLKAGIAVNGFYSQYRHNVKDLAPGTEPDFTEALPGYSFNSVLQYNILLNKFGESIYIESGFGYRWNQSIPIFKPVDNAFEKVYLSNYVTKKSLYLPIRIGGSFNAMGILWTANLGREYYKVPRFIESNIKNVPVHFFKKKRYINHFFEFGFKLPNLKYFDSITFYYMKNSKITSHYMGFYSNYYGISFKFLL
jgi:hypothetical protein